MKAPGGLCNLWRLSALALVTAVLLAGSVRGAGLWPLDPIYDQKFDASALNAPLYKYPKKIWPDLPYTDNDIKKKALRGFLWTIKFMGSDNNIKGNENNYLTMLATMYCSAADPYLRRMALEEAKGVKAVLMAEKFIYKNQNDIDKLLEFLILFESMGIADKNTRKEIIGRLIEEKAGIVKRVQDQKNAARVNGDDLFETMLLTYHLTSLKKRLPAMVPDGLPDLSDFFEILGLYEYWRESEQYPEFSNLSDDDKDGIIDDLYNITHVIFVVCDYNSYFVPARYFQREIDYMLKYGGLACSKYNYDPDLVFEIAYVFRLMGYPLEWPFIKKQWQLVLGSQRPDGSWKDYSDPSGLSARDRNYNTFHATCGWPWTCWSNP